MSKMIYLRFEVRDGGADAVDILERLEEHSSALDLLNGVHMVPTYTHQCGSENPADECVHLVTDRQSEVLYGPEWPATSAFEQ